MPLSPDELIEVREAVSLVFHSFKPPLTEQNMRDLEYNLRQMVAEAVDSVVSKMEDQGRLNRAV